MQPGSILVSVWSERLDESRGRGRRLDSLTGARFVAALAVFLYHASLAFPAEGVFGRTLAAAGRNGAVGVDFFFALSGFVLAWSWQPGSSKRNFLRRRFARLAPAYWVALVYGLAWSIALYGGPLVAAIHAVPAVLGIQAWFPDPAVHYAANGPGWSVSAEVFFYLVFPLVIAATSARSGRRAVFAAAIVTGGVVPFVLARVVTGDAESWVVNTLPAVRVGEFLCGLVLAVALRQGRRVPVRPRTALAVLLAVYVLVPLAPPWVPHQAFTLAVVLLVIAALAQADERGTGTVLASRVPVRLGEWSYCFYLVHVMTTQILLLVCARVVSPRLLGPVWLVSALIACVVLAALLHRFVERPFERRLRGPARPVVPRRVGHGPVSRPAEATLVAPTPSRRTAATGGGPGVPA